MVRAVMSDSLILYGTPRSHFTRIARILLHELELDFRFEDVGNVGSNAAFGGNPLMQVPVLTDGERSVFESHRICEYLVERQQADPLGITQLDWDAKNYVSVVHGVMNAEVRLILAARCGMPTTGGVFDKAREVLEHGVSWLEERCPAKASLSYPTVCAAVMWDHLRCCDMIPYDYAPRLHALAQRMNETYESFAATPPQTAA